MKKLEGIFIKAGFRHELVKRLHDIAIFKRTQLGLPRFHYEVVQIGSHNGYNMGTAYIIPAETYPGNSLWGIRGWTCTTLEHAEKVYDKLQKKRSRKRQKVAA